MDALAHTYSPRWAPHVTGAYSDRDEDGQQRITWSCAGCGDAGQRTCTSGKPHGWVDRFALEHFHHRKKTA